MFDSLNTVFVFVAIAIRLTAALLKVLLDELVFLAGTLKVSARVYK